LKNYFNGNTDIHLDKYRAKAHSQLMADQKQQADWQVALIRASGRVGRTPEERTAWLLDFAQCTLAQRDPNDLVAEIVAFAIAEGWRGAGVLDRPALSINEIERLRAGRIVSQLRELFQGKPWDFRTADYNLIFSFRRTESGTFERLDRGPLESMFVWKSINLIPQHLQSIATCKRCEKLFFAGRKGQIYCSDNCGHSARNKRFAENSPAEHKYELRRRSYLKKVERSKGPEAAANVKKEGPRNV
jgi:hypothetical protein